MKENIISVIVFGTPKNKEGFTYKVIYGAEYTEEKIRSFKLDEFSKEKHGIKKTFIVHNFKKQTVFSEYRLINPADDDTTRSSYIAVCCITQGKVLYNEATNLLLVTSEVHGSLKQLRDENNRFSKTFDIENYSYNFPKVHIEPSDTIDLLCHVANNQSAKKKHYITPDRNDIPANENYIFSGNTNNQNLKDRCHDLNLKVKELEEQKNELQIQNQQNQKIKKYDNSDDHYHLDEDLNNNKENHQQKKKKNTFHFNVLLYSQDTNFKLYRYFMAALFIAITLSFLIFFNDEEKTIEETPDSSIKRKYIDEVTRRFSIDDVRDTSIDN